MSGLRPIELDYFFARLHARGMDVTKLAETVCLSRPTVTRVLNGSRRRGPVWKKLVPLLTPKEIELLDVAHCSPWNKKRLENRPKWTPEKAAQFGYHQEAVHA
jgi:DNA-binding MarR family transcriptional regulator